MPVKKTVKNRSRIKITDTCQICGRTNRDINKFINHHVRYLDIGLSEVTIRVCFGCHERLHGRRTFNNYFEKVYGKDLGPYVFALRVVQLYEERLGGWLPVAVAVREQGFRKEGKKNVA